MNFVLTLVLSVLFQLFLPWWTIALVPFLVHAARPVSGSDAFWGSFSATALIWGVYSFYQHYRSSGSISDRIAEMFFLPNGILLLIVTSLIGGLVGGFGGLSGYLVRNLFKKPAAAA